MRMQYIYKALVTDVIDGDTVWTAIDLGFNIVKNVKIRLAGIDSKELKDKANREKALAAKKYLEDKVLNKEVKLKSLKPGKYNERYIGFLYFDGAKESVNDQMVRDGFASPYDNKRKESKPDEGKTDESKTD